MKKKFVFINLSINSGYQGVNHGLAYLVPIVKKHSYEVSCLNILDEIKAEKFSAKIKALNPSIIAFSCTSQQLKYLIKYSSVLGSDPKILQIAGGVGPTLDPQVFLSRSNIDGVCIGEGDIAIEQLLDNIKNNRDILSTLGFYWKQNGGIKKNPVPQFIKDLSLRDFPDYTVFDRKFVVQEGHLHIMLSRGCPYNCHYCCNKALSEVYPSRGGYFRLPSVEYSIKLLESLISQYPETKFISFEDDLLIANQAWFLSFAEEYHKRINKPYRIDVRVECITPEIVAAMKRSGCQLASSGLESGNERLRHELLNRKHTNAMYIEKSKMIKAAGIELSTFNIVGFPFETEEEMADTFELNKLIAPNTGVCTFFYPYKNTKLYQTCDQVGLLKDEDKILGTTNYNTRPTIKMTRQQERVCLKIQKRMMAYFAKQNYLTRLTHLPNGLSRYPLMFLYLAKYFLSTNPWLRSLTVRLLKGLR